MKKIKTLLFLFFIFSVCAGNCYSQSINESVNKLRENGRLEDAEVLLQKYHREHPKDLKTTLLFANVCYELKKYPAFFDLYEEAFVLDSTNYFLRFDYAKMLLEINEHEKALIQFDEYLKHDPANPEALFAKAKIYYWNEEYNEASGALSKVLAKDPTNAEAKEMYGQVLVAKSKWVKLNVTYLSNSQPINIISPAVEGGMYTSPYSTLKVKIVPMLFIRKTSSNINMYWGAIENRTFFSEIGMGVNYGLGTIMFPKEAFGLSGKIEFDKYAERYIYLTLGGERKPYITSLPSLDSAMMILSASSSLTLITKESWNGKGIIETNFFDGTDNPITSLNAYLFAPRLKTKDFYFKLGYKINFSSSRTDKFFSDKTNAEILSGGTPVYTGYYYPYYTPKNLLSHTILFSMNYNPSRETQASLDMGYGFGIGEKGYYFPVGNNFVSKDYRTERFNPVEVGLHLQSLLTPKVTLEIDFRYSKNFFYITRSIGMGVRVNFWK